MNNKCFYWAGVLGLIGCARGKVLDDDVMTDYCEKSLECSLVEGQTLESCIDSFSYYVCPEEAEALYICLTGLSCEALEAEEDPQGCSTELDTYSICTINRTTE